MKTIKLIEKLRDQAIARAHKSQDGFGSAEHTRMGTEVYSVTALLRDGIDLYTLRHYGTVIAQVSIQPLQTSYRLVKVYGESRSDADAINTFIAEFSIKDRYTFKPKNGGFQLCT